MTMASQIHHIQVCLHLLRGVLWLLGRLPLRTLQGLGAAIGAQWSGARREARRARDNLRLAYPDWTVADIDVCARAVLQQTGASFLELPWLWSRRASSVLGAIRVVQGEALYRNALASPRGLIVAAPHLGAWEALNLYLSAQSPIQVLYRAPKSLLVERLINRGRQRLGATPVPADASGVRSLLRTLKSGGCVGILPDQVPREGEGEWAPFFGHSALTMTLLPKLAQRTDAIVLFAWAERLPHGQGYAIRFIDAGRIDDTTALNRAVEHLARACPEQYQWTYKRFPGEAYRTSSNFSVAPAEAGEGADDSA